MAAVVRFSLLVFMFRVIRRLLTRGSRVTAMVFFSLFIFLFRVIVRLVIRGSRGAARMLFSLFAFLSRVFGGLTAATVLFLSFLIFFLEFSEESIDPFESADRLRERFRLSCLESAEFLRRCFLFFLLFCLEYSEEPIELFESSDVFRGRFRSSRLESGDCLRSFFVLSFVESSEGLRARDPRARFRSSFGDLWLPSRFLSVRLSFLSRRPRLSALERSFLDLGLSFLSRFFSFPWPGIGLPFSVYQAFGRNSSKSLSSLFLTPRNLEGPIRDVFNFRFQIELHLSWTLYYNNRNDATRARL